MRLFISALLLSLSFAIPAQAAESKPFTATYGFYTGGVRMIQMKAHFDVRPDTYGVDVDARTIGLFEKLLPWWGTFETKGVSKEFKPVQHNYTVSWRGDVQKGTFNYDPAGTFHDESQTKDGKTALNPVDLDIAAGTRDMLSTIMVTFTQFQDTGKCAGDVLTFDNARSMIVRFTDAGEGEMSNAKLSSYTGPAHACTVEVIPQKGKWPKKPRGWLRIQQQSKAGGKLPILWLASPAPGLPAIPVRVDIHTKYGDVIAHLTAVQ